jgi:hypothetical protein
MRKLGALHPTGDTILLMKQQDALRQAMNRSGQTRDRFAIEMGVSRRALDKWLLPDSSRDFRRMPEIAWRLLASQYGVRKSEGLSMPYDWSNPAMADNVLIISVLRRANFPDLVRLCADHGLDTVRGQVDATLKRVPDTERPILARILARMLQSIDIAFSKRQAA